MPVIYNVTIEHTGKGKENLFHITWHNTETDRMDSFNREAEITPEETQSLWQLGHQQLPIGKKLSRFLDGDARHFKRVLDEARHQGESLQVYLRTCNQTADWPFELLADNNTFLLPQLQRLHLVRYVSDWGTEKKIPPENRPLKLLFMACSAMDVKPELDFEQEEEVIFQITARLAIDMEVEDSGSLAGLRGRLEVEQYDVVHLSGHANIDEKGHPYFVMEDETGHEHQVFPDELWSEALIENPPRLLFLSGCRTGETPGSTDNTAAVSFSRVLVENYNVPAVLGWGRSVNDEQAIHAEKMLYHELSRGRSILDAVQRVRYELLTDFPGSPKPAWPLLRLYSSGIALNPIVQKGQRWRPKPRRMKYVFLQNSRVQVLAEGFVGRRRQMQTGLRALEQDYYKVGILLLGAGGLGKSCLAGKICERFPGHTLIIVHGKLNAVNLAAALTDAFILSGDEKGREILAPGPGKTIQPDKSFCGGAGGGFLEKSPLLAEGNSLTHKLANLCAAGFKEKNYLLLLDDFDQNLESIDNGYPPALALEAADLLKVLLHYLPFSGKMTQLIITSRYEFSLTEQNRDMVEERLQKVWLTSFRELQQRKKARELKNILNYSNQKLVPELVSAGKGNPLLMEKLDILTGREAAGKVPQLLEAVKNEQEAFIQKHLNRGLLRQDGGGEKLVRFLRLLSIYRRPVREEGIKLAVEKAGLEGWKELLRKGMSLSLVEHDQARRSYQVSPLLREELLKGLEDIKTYHKAAFAYYEKICAGQDPVDTVLSEEWIFHAVGCREKRVISQQGGKLAGHLRERLALQETQRKEEYAAGPGEAEAEAQVGAAAVLNKLGEVWYALDQPGKAIYYYRQALSINREEYGEEHESAAKGMVNLGKVYFYLWQKDKAKDYFDGAYKIFNKLYGPKHPDTEKVNEWLISASGLLKKFDQNFYKLENEKKEVKWKSREMNRPY